MYLTVIVTSDSSDGLVLELRRPSVRATSQEYRPEEQEHETEDIHTEGEPDAAIENEAELWETTVDPENAPAAENRQRQEVNEEMDAGSCLLPTETGRPVRNRNPPVVMTYESLGTPSFIQPHLSNIYASHDVSNQPYPCWPITPQQWMLPQYQARPVTWVPYWVY